MKGIVDRRKVLLGGDFEHEKARTRRKSKDIDILSPDDDLRRMNI